MPIFKNILDHTHYQQVREVTIVDLKTTFLKLDYGEYFPTFFLTIYH